MQTPDNGLPRIPDDWNREATRVNAKNTGSKQTQRTGVGAANANNGTSSTNTTTARKRKRNTASSSVTCASAAIATLPYVSHTATPVCSTDKTSNKTDNVLTSNSTKDQPMLQTTQTTENAAVPPMSASSQRHCEETESVVRGLYHQVEKLARRPGCALQEGIYLDSIMTHIPYTDVLEQMFGGNAVTDSACVPVVTRAYEESYMREIMSASEEPCIMGSNCECQFIDEHNPFIGVQFTLPVEAFSSSSATASMVEELSSNKLCVLCCRKNTQSLFYEALYNHRAYSSCIQLYGNICDRPGEYAKEAMLICPLSGPVENMPLPVVAHQRNRYSVVDYNGVRQLRQHRVSYEDFHAPSSSRY
jgi:hypothetical protein